MHGIAHKSAQTLLLKTVFNKQKKEAEQEIQRHFAETLSIFRTAYVTEKNNLSFCCLVDLQIRNGLNMVTLLLSHHSCANIIEHI